jgi:hypothetical protein
MEGLTDAIHGLPFSLLGGPFALITNSPVGVIDSTGAGVCSISAPLYNIGSAIPSALILFGLWRMLTK